LFPCHCSGHESKHHRHPHCHEQSDRYERPLPRFQGYTYRWTNLTSTTPGYIGATNSAAASATNLFARLSRDYTNSLRFSYAGAAKIQVSTFVNGGLTISNDAGWLTNLFTTNVITGGATAMSLQVPT